MKNRIQALGYEYSYEGDMRKNKMYFYLKEQLNKIPTKNSCSNLKDCKTKLI